MAYYSALFCYLVAVLLVALVLRELGFFRWYLDFWYGGI